MLNRQNGNKEIKEDERGSKMKEEKEEKGNE
jgi:hypothetical protein